MGSTSLAGYTFLSGITPLTPPVGGFGPYRKGTRKRLPSFRVWGRRCLRGSLGGSKELHQVQPIASDTGLSLRYGERLKILY